MVNINMMVFYIYIDVEYMKDINLKGNMLEQVFEYMVLLWGDYIFNDGLLLGLILGIGGCFIGFSYGDLVNSFKVGSVVVMDVVVKYDLVCFGMVGFSIVVNVNNLFDCEYVVSCFQIYGCFWGVECQVVVMVIFCF